jgi:hypothetical protein
MEILGVAVVGFMLGIVFLTQPIRTILLIASLTFLCWSIAFRVFRSLGTNYVLTPYGADWRLDGPSQLDSIVVIGWQMLAAFFIAMFIRTLGRRAAGKNP